MAANPDKTVLTAQSAPEKGAQFCAKPARVALSKLSGFQVKARIAELDGEINEIVERTIRNLSPGRGFDRSLLRQMTKAQRERNRIVAARFTSLLDLGHPEAKELLSRLLEIAE